MNNLSNILFKNILYNTLNYNKGLVKTKPSCYKKIPFDKGVFMNKRIKLKTAIIVWISVLLLSIGTTYAIKVWSSGNTILFGRTSCFGVNYTKGQNINFSNMAASVAFDIDKAASTYVNISRDVNCDVCGSGKIVANFTSTISLADGALKYVVKDNYNNTLSEGSITSAGNTTIYNSVSVRSSAKGIYNIYFWLDSTIVTNAYLEANISATIASSVSSTGEKCQD